MKLHPRNRNFVWQPATTEPTYLTPDAQAQYNELGYVLIRDVFSGPELERAIGAIDPMEARTTEYLNREFGGEHSIARAEDITFSVHLVTKSTTLKAFSLHPRLKALCRDTIGAQARLYWDQAVYKKPDTPDEFPWHQDNGYTYVEPQQYVTCWVALTDATLDNGCPWVVPGLHKHGTLEHETTPLGFSCFANHPDALPVEANAGDVVLFSSLTPHRTGPNTTNATRKSYILQYAPDGAYAYRNGDRTLQDDPARQYLLG